MTLRISKTAFLISTESARAPRCLGFTLTRPTGAIFSHDPHGASENLARLDLPKCGYQLLRNRRSEVWELLDDFSDESNNIDGAGVVGVAQKLHEDIDDIGGYFGEFDGARVDALNEELTVLEVLLIRSCLVKMLQAYLVVILLHCAGELLLEHKHHILDVPARNHLQSDTQCFTLDFHVGTNDEHEFRDFIIDSPVEDLENIHYHAI
jgi:hypothetical protein